MLVHSIFYKRQTFTYYSIEEMMNMQHLNHLQLRETNAGHVSKIRKYVVDNFLNNTLYFPPIVACIEPSECFTEDKPSRLIIIDRTHEGLKQAGIEVERAAVICHCRNYEL